MANRLPGPRNSQVPMQLASLPSLGYLDLSFNEFTSLPANFSLAGTNLSTIYLNNNRIAATALPIWPDAPDAWSGSAGSEGYQGLQTVNLTSNQLSLALQDVQVPGNCKVRCRRGGRLWPRQILRQCR